MTTSALPPHPELEEHGSFEHLKLGRSEVRHDPKTLRLASYFDDAVLLPSIPDAADYGSAVAAWPMFGNDRLGDCTIAAAGHMVQAWSAHGTGEVIPAEQAILDAYIPGTGPDDTGRMEVDVLNYWRTVGIAGDKIEAYAYIDPQNLDHVRAAIFLFGGVYTGIALPLSAQGQQVWDVAGDGKSGNSAPGSWGGHAVPYVAYVKGAGFTTITWAHPLAVTEAFHLAYCDELYAPISRDFLNAAGASPAGFDLAALQADLAQLTGQAAAAAEDRPEGDTVPPVDGGAVIEAMVDAPAEDQGAFDQGYFWNG